MKYRREVKIALRGVENVKKLMIRAPFFIFICTFVSWKGRFSSPDTRKQEVELMAKMEMDDVPVSKICSPCDSQRSAIGLWLALG
jgi:hypothetical protein